MSCIPMGTTEPQDETQSSPDRSKWLSPRMSGQPPHGASALEHSRHFAFCEEENSAIGMAVKYEA